MTIWVPQRNSDQDWPGVKITNTTSRVTADPDLSDLSDLWDPPLVSGWLWSASWVSGLGLAGRLTRRLPSVGTPTRATGTQSSSWGAARTHGHTAHCSTGTWHVSQFIWCSGGNERMSIRICHNVTTSQCHNVLFPDLKRGGGKPTVFVSKSIFKI